MAKAFETWTVLRNEPLLKLADNLWIVRGFMPDNRTERVMTLARRSDGKVLIHNAIALDEPEMKVVESFGALDTLIVPNGLHRQDARIYKQRYSNLRVVCPRSATKKVEQVVHVDGNYEGLDADPDVKVFYVEGANEAEGVMQVKSADGTTLVFNDVVMNQKRLPFPIGFILAPTGRASVPRVFRLLTVKDKRAMAAQLERLAAIPDLQRIIVSHGRMITERPGEILKAVAAELVG